VLPKAAPDLLISKINYPASSINKDNFYSLGTLYQAYICDTGTIFYAGNQVTKPYLLYFIQEWPEDDYIQSKNVALI
jgi:hypothetical protein